jgi:DNA-binding NarL/FixJ family response regulator
MALDQEDDFEVVAQVSTCADAEPYLEAVDIAIVDLMLADGTGSEVIPRLRRANPDAQALVLTSTTARPALAEAVERGAAAILDKRLALADVVTAVRRLRAGVTLLPPSEVFALMREAGEQREREAAQQLAFAELTPRELDVLGALAEGLDSRTIAARFGITVRTERNHASSILRKLGVHTQLQAVLLGLRYGIVSLHVPPVANEAELG